MTPLAMLIQARDVISLREHWAACEEELREGTHCSTTAIGCSPEGYEAHVAFCDINGLDKDYPYSGVVDFNDTHSHAEVLDAFDKAIAALTAGKGTE